MPAAPPPQRDQLLSLLEPAIILYTAVTAFLAVCLEHLKTRPTALLHPYSLRDEAFSRFWAAFKDPKKVPADPSQLTGSAALIPPLLSSLSGTVLDIGPGNGIQLRYFPTGSSLKKIYGAEPATGLHGELRAQIAAANLQGKYEILPCTARLEELRKELGERGVEMEKDGGGVFDTIVCVRVLCCVPDPERVARDLHRLLRPGGRLVVVEHVVNPWRSGKGSVLARAVQSMYMALQWSFFISGCELTRDTLGTLKGAAEESGGWKEVDVEPHFGWGPMPYIAGSYIKKG